MQQYVTLWEEKKCKNITIYKFNTKQHMLDHLNQLVAALKGPWYAANSYKIQTRNKIDANCLSLHVTKKLPTV